MSVAEVPLMNERDLGRLFKNLVSYSLLSALAAPACGGTTTD
jgi:hypothetical protein